MIGGILRGNDGMQFKIIGITKRDGKVVPDPSHIVATVTMEEEKQKIHLDVHDSKYEERLRRLFSSPAPRMESTTGGTTASGQSVDPAHEMIQPWNPEMIKAVSNNLFSMGLRYIISGEKE